MMPLDFPPWDTVYDHFRRWNKRGVWEQALDFLNEQARLAHLCAGLQSVKTQYASQDRGTDGGKKGQRP